MGTRSLTYVYDGRDTKNTQALLCMYRQFDGYPSGAGQEIADFAKGFTIVNGFSPGQENAVGTIANGAGCFAAQLVAHFKKAIGGFYLCTAEQDQDSGQEYEYHLFVQEGVPVQIKCYKTWNGKTLIIDCEAGEWDAKLAEYEAANKDD